MKAKYFLLVLVSICTFFLSGCGNDERYSHVPEHCGAYIRSLPEGDKREALAEWCMTNGTLQRTTPKTF